MIFAAAAVIALASAPAALAWGRDAHQVIGTVAQSFLTDKAEAYLSRNLRRGESLATVASWADRIKRKKGYTGTGSLHYVNINDDPPTSCGYDDDRDCKSGNCIVRAIADYTAQAMCGNRVSKEKQSDAVKFLAHLVGEITQPLHATGRDRGGTRADLTFNDRYASLHWIWDDHLPRKRIFDDFDATNSAYADFLIEKIKSGEYKQASSTWISEHDLTECNHNKNSLAAIDWAIDSDALDCSVVWPSYDANPDQDFSEAYYTLVVSTVDLQIAKGGYRLANWINRIAETC